MRITVIVELWTPRILFTLAAVVGLIAGGFFVASLIGAAVSALLFALTIFVYITAGVAVVLGAVKSYVYLRDAPTYRAISNDIAYRNRAEKPVTRRAPLHVNSERVSQLETECLNTPSELE